MVWLGSVETASEVPRYQALYDIVNGARLRVVFLRWDACPSSRHLCSFPPTSQQATSNSKKKTVLTSFNCSPSSYYHLSLRRRASTRSPSLLEPWQKREEHPRLKKPRKRKQPRLKSLPPQKRRHPKKCLLLLLLPLQRGAKSSLSKHASNDPYSKPARARYRNILHSTERL